jgi:hypothetical protein
MTALRREKGGKGGVAVGPYPMEKKRDGRILEDGIVVGVKVLLASYNATLLHSDCNMSWYFLTHMQHQTHARTHAVSASHHLTFGVVEQVARGGWVTDCLGAD